MRGGWHHAARRSSCRGEASHQPTGTFVKAGRAPGGSYLDHQAKTGSSAPPLLTTTTTTPPAQEVSSLVPLSLPQAFLAFLAGRVPAGTGHVQVSRDDRLPGVLDKVGNGRLRSAVQHSTGLASSPSTLLHCERFDALGRDSGPSQHNCGQTSTCWSLLA